MRTVFFVSHPEVIVDPSVPIPQWSLSRGGVERMRAFATSTEVQNLAAVWASRETKAVEAGGLLAARLGVPVRVHPDLHENNRSATGFLPAPDFERTADAFFANPEASIRGWERAVDAQRRVAAAVKDILEQAPSTGDIALVAHGGVGALLLCHYLDLPISRQADQPFQGHYWTFDLATRQVLHRWRPIAPR